MNYEKNIQKKESNRKKIKKIFAVGMAGIATIFLLNKGIERNSFNDIEYEKQKIEMIDQINSIQDSKNNFSRLLYPNVETVNGKRYIAMHTNGIVVSFETEFVKQNYMKYNEIENTGQPHLTANKEFAYTMFENGTELVRLSSKNTDVKKIRFDKPLTNISISSTNDFLFIYSNETGFIIYDKDLNNKTKIDLRNIKEIETDIKDICINKFEDKIMLIGSGFKHIYFMDLTKEKMEITRLKLDSNLGKVENPKLVKFENNFFIKSEKDNFIYEIDGKTGKLLSMKEMPKEE